MSAPVQTIRPARWAWRCGSLLPARWRYPLAVVLAVIEVGLRRAVVPWFGLDMPNLFTLPAVMVATLWLGWGPGLVASAVGVAGAEIWVIANGTGFGDSQTPLRSTSALILFALVCTVLHMVRAAQIKAQESAMRLRALAEATLEGIVETRNGRIVDCNEQFAQLTGCPVAELRGRVAIELIAPGDRDRVRRNFDANEESVVEHVMIREDGTRLTVEAHGRPITLGSATRFTVIRDISERKRAEESLRKSQEELRLSEQKFAKAFAGSPVAVALTRLESGEFLDVNDTWVALTGYARDEVLGQSARKLPIWPSSEDAARFVTELRKNGSLSGWEQVFAKKSGETYIALLSAQILDIHGDRVLLSTLIDITARKQAEAMYRKLSQRNEFLARVVEISSQPFGVGYPNGRLGTVNRAFEKLTGYSAEELRSMNWAEVLTPPEWREPEREQLAKLIRTGQPVRYEKEYLRKNGTRVPIELFVHVIRDESGEPECFFSFIIDLTARKAAEAATRQSEDRLRFALETCHIGAWDLDLVDHTAFRALEHDRIFGYSELQSQWTYEMFLDHILPDDRPAVNAKFQAAIATQGDWNFECRIRRADGEQRWIWATGRHRPDAAGGMRRMAGIVQDITQRKLAEEALKQAHDELEARVQERTAELRESQQRYTSMIEGVRDYAIIFLTPDGRIATWNKAAEQIKGYTAEEIIGQPLGRFYPPEDIAAGKPELELRIAMTEGRFEDENWRIHKDGSRYWASVVLTALHDANGQVNGFVKIIRDLTARKQAEAKLAESERAFRTLAESMPQMVWMCQPDGLNIYFNQRWVDYTGLTLEESYGRGWNTPFHPDDKQPAWNAWNHATATGDIYQIECRLRRADGEYRWFITRGVPFRDGEGRIVKWFGTCTDIDDMKLAEAQIRSHAAELQRSNRELEHFAYVASHDLQEPLRTIGSFSELLANRYRGRLDSDADEFIAFIVNGAKRMQILINDLLALSRVGTRGQPFAPVECADSLQAAQENLEISITENGAVITRDPLPVVKADRGQLTQLFQNLLGNAIKFHRPGAPPRIHVSAARNNGAWQLSVRDNGIGIQPEYFDRIFVVFQRLHERDKYPGTGIGLAICMKIVERHGGRLWVESTPEAGSCFHFTIPDNISNS